MANRHPGTTGPVLIGAFACALALALSACGEGAGSAAAPADIATYTVQPRGLEVMVSEKGTLKARQQLLVRPNIPGQAKIMSLIEEGTVVEEGAVLCELDKTDIDKNIETLQNRVIQLNGDVAAAEAELAIQLSQNEADVADAELKLRFSKIELERYEKGEFVQEDKKRNIRVEAARSELERAAAKYEQMPALLAEGFVTATQVEEERIKKIKAQSEVELAELDLQTYLRYTAPKNLEQKKADVKNAGLELDRAKQRATAREVQRRSALERQKTELGNVKTSLEQKLEIRENMTLRAPGPGLVIYGDARNPWDEREIKVGEMVYSRQALLTLPDLSEMQVVVAVHEADIARLAVGQKAIVTVESARGESIEGEVSRVATVANQTGRRWSDQSKRFNVEVSIKGGIDGLGLKPGLTSKVSILVATLQDVLAVPAQCVFAESGKFFVFKRDGNGVSRAQVEIEDGNTSHVVVTSGIAPGDRVLLYNPEKAGGGGAGAASQPDAGASKPNGDGGAGGKGRPSGGRPGAGKGKGNGKP